MRNVFLEFFSLKEFFLKAIFFDGDFLVFWDFFLAVVSRRTELALLAKIGFLAVVKKLWQLLGWREIIDLLMLCLAN